MNKRHGRFFVFITITILIILILVLNIINSLIGNPISASIANKKIHTYVSSTYPGQNLVISKPKYNFKFDDYYSTVQSPTSEDTKFMITISKGEVVEDNYQYEVTNKSTTFDRLETSLDKAVEAIIEKDFPYETRLVLATMKTGEEDTGKLLTLDMPFDLHNLPLPVSIIVWTSTEKPSYDIAAKRLLELKALMEKNEIKVAYYSMDVEYPYHEENGQLMPDNFNNIAVNDFPADQLLESSNLAQILEEHEKTWEAEANKVKDKEMGK